MQNCKLILCEKQSFSGVKKNDTKVAGTVKTILAMANTERIKKNNALFIKYSLLFVL